MQTLNYWKQFENTGKIEDYLSYKEKDISYKESKVDPTSAVEKEHLKDATRSETSCRNLFL